MFSALRFSYNIMLGCWQKNPDERPSFEQLCEMLEELLQHETVSGPVKLS